MAAAAAPSAVPPPPSRAGDFALPQILTYPSPASASTTTTQPQTDTTTTTAPAPVPVPGNNNNSSSGGGCGGGGPELIAQGAESRLYKTTFLRPGLAAALKYRPPKAWRHPSLDARLTRHRILSEARILAKCRREAVACPAVLALDEAAGWLLLEWVRGCPVRVALNAWLARRRAAQLAAGGDGYEAVAIRGEGGEGGGDDQEKEEEETRLLGLLSRMGEAVGSMHRAGIIHGDLTTSNMMLRPPSSSPTTSDSAGDNSDEDQAQARASEAAQATLAGEVVIIDFGLASQGAADEDRAVDLYVLERAFASTHPRAEALFPRVLDAYARAFKQGPVVLRKLEDVRMRGRKRSMLG